MDNIEIVDAVERVREIKMQELLCRMMSSSKNVVCFFFSKYQYYSSTVSKLLTRLAFKRNKNAAMPREFWSFNVPFGG